VGDRPKDYAGSSGSSHTERVGVFSTLRELIRHLGDLTCRQAVELVTDYVEGAMTPHDRRRFERHLRDCPDCTTYVDQVRLTSDTLGRLHPEPPSGATRDALLQTFRDFHRE
jgi:Putative zinc-finger